MAVVLSLAVGAAACTDSSSSSSPTGDGVVTTSAPGPVGRPGMVRISEVHYHDSRDDPSAEFVELVNLGELEVQLEGWCLRGMDYCFEEPQVIVGGGFVVVSQAAAAGTLSNDIDDIQLVDALEQVIDRVSYADRAPWPEDADGGGLSLQRLDFDVDAANPAAWVAAMPTPGAPLADAEPDAIGDVVVSEVHYHPESEDPAETFVELLNITDAPIDLAGWCLAGAAYCVEQPTTIAARSVLVIAGQFGTDRLSRRRDRLRLVDADGRVHDTVRYADRDPWPAIADGDGASLHRRNAALSGTLPGNWDAAPPTPGAVDALDRALVPIFSSVEIDTSPAPSTPIEVRAVIGEGEAAVTSQPVDVEVRLWYVVDFGEEVEVRATVSDDRTVRATIPGQPAGALVRFRLEGDWAGDVGGWPRAGDGARYGGTVVGDPAAEATALPRLQWFMPDDAYREARSTTTLHGNNGFPTVMAFDGHVFDNVTIRVKGNQARSNTKRKWKVMLPAGHDWDAGGRIAHAVDQFDLLPAATDKSYSREILVSDMQVLSGGWGQQVFPLRLERNNAFEGLYMYGESPDGGWRDRQGLSDLTYVWKVEGITKMKPGDLSVTRDEFRRKYERITMTHLDDGDQLIRDLISTLDQLSGDALVRFAFEHIDVPQVVEALATMRVVQHAEWQHKNHFVMYDPVDEKWRLVPIDFDLTFGRSYLGECKARCDAVNAWPFVDYPNEQRLARVLLEYEPFRSMVDRRTRTLSEAYLAAGVLEARLAELLEWMGGDAAADRAKWTQYGEAQSMATAQQIIVDRYLTPKRAMYLDSDRYLPGAQPSSPRVRVVDVVTDADGVVTSARLVNEEAVAIDVSGRELADIGAVLPAGTVVPAGGAITIVFVREPVAADRPLELVVLARRF